MDSLLTHKYLAPALAAVPVLALLYRLSSKSKSLKGQYPLPPGPPRVPIFGNAFNFPPDRWYEAFTTWVEEHLYDTTGVLKSNGKDTWDLMYFNVLGSDIIIISNLDVAKPLLEKRSNSFRPSDMMNYRVMGWDWNVVLAQPGQFHTDCRTIFKRGIGQVEVAQFEHVIEDETKLLLKQLKELKGDPWTVVQPRMGAVVIRVTYGDSIYKQHGQELSDLNHTTLDLKKGIAQPSIALEYLEANQDLDTVRDALGMMYSAGTDNTASTFMSFIATMLLHPEVQSKIQEELDAETPPGTLPKFDQRPQLRYLDAAWRESMRLNPSTPLGVPHTAEQEDIYNGIYIPKDTMLITNIGFMCRDPRVFSDPDKYIPERWLPEHNPDCSQLPDIYDIVFGFGRRICPGQFLADRTGFTFAAALLKTYDILPLQGDTVPKEFPYKDAITRRPEE
ncbi:hypothetical protein FRC17_003749, partial [Serendipita sp. 399]